MSRIKPGTVATRARFEHLGTEIQACLRTKSAVAMSSEVETSLDIHASKSFLDFARNEQVARAGCYLLNSSIRRMGSSARLLTGSGRMISGSMFKSASYAFSSVFIFMNRHSPQKQLSVGPGMKVLLGISLRRRCNRPASVTTMISRADDSLQNVSIFSVEQTSSASMRTA